MIVLYSKKLNYIDHKNGQYNDHRIQNILQKMSFQILGTKDIFFYFYIKYSYEITCIKMC